MSVVVTQSGELDIATIDGLMERLAPHRRPGCHVVLDLRRVVLMDCLSLGRLLAAYADSAAEGWRLSVRVETPRGAPPARAHPDGAPAPARAADRRVER